MDSGGPGTDDPVNHLQLLVPLPVFLPALHAAEGWTLLPHRSLPDLCQSFCHEWSNHLHGDECRVGPTIRVIRLCLHPGLGGFPSGFHQWVNLHHLEETRMKRHPLSVATRSLSSEANVPHCIHRQLSTADIFTWVSQNHHLSPQKKTYNTQYCHDLKMYIVSMI
ncbi:hypothetical protein MHYP_G00166610 [Metynnis hypsauchen]